MPSLFRTGLLWWMQDSPWSKLLCKKLKPPNLHTKVQYKILHLRSTQASIITCKVRNRSNLQNHSSFDLLLNSTRRLDSKTIVLRTGQTLWTLKRRCHAQNDNLQFTISAQTLNPNSKLTITRPVYGPFFLIGFPRTGFSPKSWQILTQNKRSNAECICESWNLKGVSCHQAWGTKVQLQHTIICWPCKHWFFYSKLMTERLSSAFSDRVSTNRSSPKSWKLHTGKCKLGGAAPWWWSKIGIKILQTAPL